MIILSLCDFSGEWSRPYVALGYKVIRVDPKHDPSWKQERGITTAKRNRSFELLPMGDGGFAIACTVKELRLLLAQHPDFLGSPVRGMLIAPPCTDFSVSGARWWSMKDADGRTAASISLVKDCLAIKDILQPSWWVLENPAGRIRKLVPAVGRLVMSFQPSDYAKWADDQKSEAYSKRTCLYGVFNSSLEKRSLPPKMYTSASGKRGSIFWYGLGGSSEKTKELRSKTPQGFSRAFAKANP